MPIGAERSLPKGISVTHTLTVRNAFPFELLQQFWFCAQRQFYFASDHALTVPISSVTDMVNRFYTDTTIRFSDTDTRRALLELQAMDTLRFSWKGESVVLLYNDGFVPPDREKYYQTFAGSFALYQARPALEYVQQFLKKVPNGPRRIPLDRISRHYHGSTNTVLYMLRVLRMMRVVNYKLVDNDVQITSVDRTRCNETVYNDLFLRTN